MYLFKIINDLTGHTYIGLSKYRPEKSFALKFELSEWEEGIPRLERDMLMFGQDKFTVLPIVELNDEAKAKKKANMYISHQENPYNPFYFERQ